MPQVEHYIDGIIIHIKILQEHVNTLDTVLKRIKKHQMRINLSKCKFFALKIDILGHTVSNSKIMMNDEKIACIRERLAPKNRKQLEKFLGLTNYYRRFIKAYATIVAPLNFLLKKDTLWRWEPECHEAFEILKRALISYPVLRSPDLTKKFTIHTDASDIAIGGILVQFDSNGIEYVMEYASEPLNGSKRHWTTTEKECYAVIYSIRHLRHYLFGIEFDVVTDHYSLRWLMSLRDPIGRLARWAAYL